MDVLKVEETISEESGPDLKESLLKIREWIYYLKSKWPVIILAGLLGGGIGYMNAYRQKAVYTAILSFVLEEEKSSGASGAMGLASSFGFGVGNSESGAFSGANLLELMKSRTLVEKALLNPITVHNKQESLATYFIEFNQLNADWDKKPALRNIRFDPLVDRSTFNFQQDSIMGVLYSAIIGTEGILSVGPRDKKSSIMNIQVRATDELFSKVFAESVADVVSDFYIETKSKKAKLNVSILKRQADSVRGELNSAITGVAIANDNTYNLNPALNVNRTSSTKRQFDLQVNSNMLSQLIGNLESAKVALRKETPLIQIIDRPIFPLRKDKAGKLRSLIQGGMFAVFLAIVVLVGRRFIKKALR